MGLKTQFKNGTLSNLSGIPSWTLDATSAQTAAMVTNHDLERDATTLRYQDGSQYVLGNYFLLAYPYGKPFVYDGFTFSTSSTGQSPPADSSGFIADTDCSAGTWQCITQLTGVKGMVGWHNAVASVSTVSNFTATSSSVIGFHRGSLGWIGLNDSSGASTAAYTTGLADGTYCDRITGGATSSGCAGTAVTVTGGTASVTIPAGGAVAIDVNAKSSSGGTTSPTTATTVAATFNEYATTTAGTNVYVVGNVPVLGNWDTSSAVALSSSGYPIWSGTVNLPAGTAVEYKYIKKDSSGNVTWESGSNRSYTTGTSTSYSTSDTWK